jgi:hypothetical protein
MFMLFSIFLYIFTVYVKVSHLQKLYIACFLSSIVTFLAVKEDGTSLLSKIVVSFFVICMVLGVANFLPNLTIGFFLARIVAEITNYFNVYHYVDLRSF